MNPRALSAWVGATLLLSLGSDQPLLRLLALLAAISVLAVRRRRERRLRPVLLWVGGVFLLTVLLNFLLSHTGSTVALSLPGWLPVLGGPLTLEAGLYGADVALGLSGCILAGVSLSLLLEPHELVGSLPRQLSRTGAAVGAALTLAPRLGRSVVAIREAQQMRGWRPRGMRSWAAVVVPAVLTTIEGSVLLAEAMEARAFGSGPRTTLSATPWRHSDLAVLACSLLAAVGFLLALALSQVPGWQPYPLPTAPQLSLWPDTCFLLLFAPAVLP